MQIMPDTATDIARRMGMTDFDADDVFSPEINIAMGSFYLNHLNNIFGCEELALAAYNAGQGNVSGWLANPRYSPDGVSLDVIPFSETENYLRRVNRFRQIYEIILRVTGRMR
jgi:soluble lytic murein transglycosylase